MSKSGNKKKKHIKRQAETPTNDSMNIKKNKNDKKFDFYTRIQ